MRRRLRDTQERLAYLPQALGLVWAASPRWMIAWGMLLLIQGLLPASVVFLTKYLVDSLISAVESGGTWEATQPLLLHASAMGGALLSIQLVQSLLTWVRTAQSELVSDHIRDLIHRKAVAVDLAFYESPEYHDSLSRVLTEAGSRPLALLEHFGSMMQHGITLAAMAAIIVPYGVVLPLALVLTTLPAFWIVVRYNKQYHAWWEEATPVRRRAQYLDMLLTNSQSAAEVRLFDLGRHFIPVYKELRSGLRSERLDLERKHAIGRTLATLLGLVITVIILGWIGLRALRGAATVGDIALFYQVFNQGQGLMRSLLSSAGQVYGTTLFLRHLFEFLRLRPSVVSPSHPEPAPSTLQKGIRFRDVTFFYPGSTTPALHKFDLAIPAGQTVAIVGENGAGKSTLLKLLTRFYDPTEGAVEFDGIDLRRMPLDQVWRMISVLFQFPVQYHFTAGDSIGLGDLNAERSSGMIERSARTAGIHDKIACLPRSYDTLLGKWFKNGEELSGGEWQRIAMARAFFRESPIVVLDEPTSMMDSWAEAEWFDRFKALAKNRTSVIITHRFTIARRADIIHVMQHGRIVESGTHDELVALGGLYCTSWFEQVQASNGAATPALPVSSPVLAGVADSLL